MRHGRCGLISDRGSLKLGVGVGVGLGFGLGFGVGLDGRRNLVPRPEVTEPLRLAPPAGAVHLGLQARYVGLQGGCMGLQPCPASWRGTPC